MEATTLEGIYPVGPEGFLCALLRVDNIGIYVPVWLPPIEGAQLLARQRGWIPKRPLAHDVLFAFLTRAQLSVTTIAITSFHEGIFLAKITLESGMSIDTRPSDALILAQLLDMTVEIDEELALAVGVWLSDEDISEMFAADLFGAANDGDAEGTADAQGGNGDHGDHDARGAGVADDEEVDGGEDQV